MSAPADRIRRILADCAAAGPVVRRASESPTATAPTPALSPEAGAFRDRLRARLAALRVGATSPRPEAAAPSPATAPEHAFTAPVDDGRPLEERVEGTIRRGPKGSFLLAERRHPLSERHGNVLLADMLDHPLVLRRRERAGRPETAIDPRSAAFLDVETTGLSGGTGTIAFLIGVGRVEGSDFVVRQYFTRDFPDEPAVLQALADDLGDAPLVTFNGRSFDWPLLSTRLSIHRTAVAPRAHVDLLPPARRLWAKSLASHALGDLERHVMGVTRGDDLPGALIPAAYFDWLRTGKSATIALAFSHNEVDIVSLAALSAVVSRILSDPASRTDAAAGDHLATALLLLDHGETARARACLEAAAAAGLPEETRSVRRLLGSLQRRAGDLDAAARTWERWIADADDAKMDFDAHPYESLAKLAEHRRRDPKAAMAWVEKALDRCPRGAKAREALEHRAARLSDKAR